MRFVPIPRLKLLAVAMLGGACAAIAWGQVSIQPPPTPQTMPAAGPSESPIPSAEKVFEQLLRDRETADAAATAPGGGVAAGSRPSATSAPGLLPEGEKIIARTGRLQKDAQTGAVSLVFDDKPGFAHYKPMPVLPTRTLAAMEDVSDFGARPMTFPINAEATK